MSKIYPGKHYYKPIDALIYLINNRLPVQIRTSRSRFHSSFLICPQEAQWCFLLFGIRVHLFPKNYFGKGLARPGLGVFIRVAQ